MTGPRPSRVLRGLSVESAIENAAPAAIVLLADKGHEDYQTIGAKKHDFSDKAIARQSIEALHCTPSAPAASGMR